MILMLQELQVLPSAQLNRVKMTCAFFRAHEQVNHGARLSVPVYLIWLLELFMDWWVH
jgi:hypothetical protein